VESSYGFGNERSGSKKKNAGKLSCGYTARGHSSIAELHRVSYCFQDPNTVNCPIIKIYLSLPPHY
jgi:hypothetical protein